MEKDSPAQPYISLPCGALKGSLDAPSDKSLSHRALLLGSQRLGTLEIAHLLEGDDVKATAAALRQLGVDITRQNSGHYLVRGVGIGGLQEPAGMLDLGNSGTAVRLLMGLVAPYEFTSFFTGDASLCKRPMQRVLTPLAESGMTYVAASGGRLPLAITGSALPMPIDYISPVASAQVKSAVLLAGLGIRGSSRLTEAVRTRDHTERMASYFGFAISGEDTEDGYCATVEGFKQPSPSDVAIHIPGDPSSAAFLIVAALICPESEITLRAVCTNPQRIGLYHWLEKMGAQLAWHQQRELIGEPVADVTVRASRLRGIDIPADAAPSMIDEYPILAVAAAFAEGPTVMRGLSELRVKESDRLQAIYDGLRANGIKATIEGDNLTIEGTGGAVPGGGLVTTHFDHRIAMSFLVMGLQSRQPVKVDDVRAIATSFPDFFTIMETVGADFRTEKRRQPRLISDRRVVIAIDGPAASGKGTLARMLSRHLNLPYLDTGTLYRAVGLRLVSADASPEDASLAIKAAQSITPQDLHDPALRQEAVGRAASIVSAMPEVRQVLLDYQRDFAAAREGAILDGRDIGTVVCPDADLKIFMTADVETRARRRHEQLQGEGLEVVFESVLSGLKERDRRDEERASAPLIPADNAIYLDTTSMEIEEVFAFILEKLEERNRAAG